MLGVVNSRWRCSAAELADLAVGLCWRVRAHRPAGQNSACEQDCVRVHVQNVRAAQNVNAKVARDASSIRERAREEPAVRWKPTHMRATWTTCLLQIKNRDARCVALCARDAWETGADSCSARVRANTAADLPNVQATRARPQLRQTTRQPAVFSCNDVRTCNVRTRCRVVRASLTADATVRACTWSFVTSLRFSMLLHVSSQSGWTSVGLPPATSVR